MANDIIRLIDANAVLKEMQTSGRAAYMIVQEAPTIHPDSLIPKGRWEKHWCDTELIGRMYEVCTNCRSCEILDTDKFWDSNHCPNCGAKMMEG